MVGNIKVVDAARIMGKSQQFVRIGLQRGLLPFGTAIQMTSMWTYHISPKLFYEYMGPEFKEIIEKECSDGRKDNWFNWRNNKSKYEDDFFVRYSGHTNGFEIFYIDGGYRENDSVEQNHLIFLFIKNTEEDVRKLEGVKELLLKKLENKNEPLEKVQKQIKK